MAIRYINFDKDDSHASDYLYTAQDFRDVYSAIVSNGIVLPLNADLSTDTSLLVTAITGGVNIGDGKLSANGAFGLVRNSVSAENVLISTDGTYKIVLEMNKVLNMIYSKAITGDLTRTDIVYQTQLATVVKSGSTYTITDTRADANLCGYANRLTESQAVILQNQLNTGWIPSAVTLTYASEDSAVNGGVTVRTYVFTTSLSLAGVINLGWKIKLTNNGNTQMGIVVGITTTTITVFCGTDYTIANSAITNVYFSSGKSPLGFPTNPDKWTVKVSINTDITKSAPTAQTWYQMAGYLLYLPIGCWNVDYKVPVRATCASASITNFPSAYTTLSSNGTSETDKEFTDVMWGNNATTKVETLRGKKKYTNTVKQDLKLLIKCDDNTVYNVSFIGTKNEAYIRAVSAYL